MREKLIAVTSRDGKITRGYSSDNQTWTSPEDKDFFTSQIAAASLIVMGRLTYESIKTHIKHQQGRLRVVMTSTPQDFQDEAIEGALEFTSESPKELVKRFENEHNEMLVVGGSKVFTDFVRDGLIDEMYLTIEPLYFGEGKPLFTDENIKIDMAFNWRRVLNDRGTLLLKYSR